MALTVFMITGGYHYDSWRRQGSRAEELGYLDLVVEMAQKAEAAKLDGIFFGDTVTAGKYPGMDPTVAGHYEPLTTLSALAAVTKRIGLIGTASTTFNAPYNVARQFSGLDSLSGGRAGWNIVTSSMGNENYGMVEMPSPEQRYQMATEFVEVVAKLWDSWADDAVAVDRERGWWGDPERIRAIDHEGEYYSVAGPINMRRSPQGRPVMVQAGSSVDGMRLGAAVGDAIYTAQPDRGKAQQFYAEFKDRVKDNGRDPDQVKILPGIVPIIGRTEKEGQELAAELGSLVNMDTGRRTMEQRLDTKLDDIDLDESIPADRFNLESSRASRQRTEIFKRLSVEQGYTLRQLIVENARGHGHGWIVGSASQAADRMVEWFESRACDGFSLNSPYIPGGLDDICDLLIPELQERGYFRDEYEGSTLREHLGIDRPGAWDTAASMASHA
jgi:FMN-dependent oxidoreductase (nitrilotriacetate monooxygenase family)